MKRTALIPAFLFAALLLYSCTSSGPCNGSLTLENPIPDTTVAVGDTLFIDLANPPVFVSSKGRVTFSINGFQEPTNIRVNIIDNPNDENRHTLLLISGRNMGEAGIELGASSGCLENSTTINITITE